MKPFQGTLVVDVLVKQRFEDVSGLMRVVIEQVRRSQDSAIVVLDFVASDTEEPRAQPVT